VNIVFDLVNHYFNQALLALKTQKHIKKLANLSIVDATIFIRAENEIP